ncbi:MAG: ribonuclease H-like domain-containing protein [Anaerovoracaceae bacterium]|jgi:uncharacterized protein YprB with RNaseH-like and TPR domain
MRITEEKIRDTLYDSSIFKEYFGDGGTACADIETTGLSPKKCAVILGGVTVPSGEGTRLALQYFADKPSEEPELLDRYCGMLSQYDTVVTYNGDSFDLPFLKKRMKAAGIRTDVLDHIYSLDMYKVLRRYSGLPELLPDMKQKTVENFMGGGDLRRDEISGGDSVRQYFEYVRSSGARRGQLLDNILLHNRDDIVQLTGITSILHKLDLHEIMYKEGFPVKAGVAKFAVKKIKLGKDGLTAEGRVSGKLPPFSYYRDNVQSEASENKFFLKFETEEVGGYEVTDVRKAGTDVPGLQELGGYESGYLILSDPDGSVQYHEANRLVSTMLKKLALMASA